MQGYFTFLVALSAPIVMCSDIDGCPMYGCRPSGTFSMTLDVPRDNVTVGWVADFFIGPVPDFGGCAADEAVLVCQSNGPGPADVGYMVLDKTSGALLWRDPILKFPTLPLIGIGGGFWGTDGGNLVIYNLNGKLLLPQIQLDPNMRPLFGAQYVDAGDGLILLVSEGGQIATWLTDGTPHASLYLNGTVERSNGTFLPVAPAVTNGNRVYILTEFKPDDSRDEANLGLQRLYAIDMLLSMDDRTHIAWSANFEKERVSARGASKLRFRPKMTAQRLYRKLHDPAVLKPSILWDAAISTVYVSLPPPMLPGVMGNGIDMLYAIKDTGNDTELVFKTAHTATNMVLFDTGGPVGNAADQLWISLLDGKLLAIEKSGVVGKVIDLSSLVKANLTITSKITTTRKRSADEDFLLFGIHVEEPTEAFKRIVSGFGVETTTETPKNYVVGIDTPENNEQGGMPLSWMVPSPEDAVVFGQIIGIQGNEQMETLFIAYAQEEGKFAKVFSLSQKPGDDYIWL